MRHVYIVRCNDESLYTGIAKDLEKRIDDHNHSPAGAKYTKSRRPVTLIWHKRTVNRITASKLEYKIKRLGKKKKEELAQKLQTSKFISTKI